MERDSGNTGKRFGRAFGEAGATAVEYAILVGAVAVVIVVGVTSLGSSVQALFGGAADALDGVTVVAGGDLAPTPGSGGVDAGPVETVPEAPSLTEEPDSTGSDGSGSDTPGSDDECDEQGPGRSGSTAACDNRNNHPTPGNR